MEAGVRSQKQVLMNVVQNVNGAQLWTVSEFSSCYLAGQHCFVLALYLSLRAFTDPPSPPSPIQWMKIQLCSCGSLSQTKTGQTTASLNVETGQMNVQPRHTRHTSKIKRYTLSQSTPCLNLNN